MTNSTMVKFRFLVLWCLLPCENYAGRFELLKSILEFAYCGVFVFTV